MTPRSLRFRAGILAVAAGAIAAAVACGSADSASLYAPNSNVDGGPSRDASSRSDAGAPGDAGIAANGVLLVHGAELGAFRVCFESALKRQPIPSADLLPDSNLVGVDVGSVVRLDPLAVPPGRIWAFAVDDIVSLYPPGKAGPSCESLVDLMSQSAHEVGRIDDDLSRGVHLLVLRGSLATSDLRMEKITLNAFSREPGTLPVQLLPLSPDLAARAAGRKIGIAVHDDDGGAGEPFIEGALPFGVVAPAMPITLTFDPDEEGVYARVGFGVTLGAALDAGESDAGDAGTREMLLTQTLADISRLSAPRALPDDWYGVGSSYVLLLLGSAVEQDAAADDRAKLHFLAVPVAGQKTARDGGEPIEDASAD